MVKLRDITIVAHPHAVIRMRGMSMTIVPTAGVSPG